MLQQGHYHWRSPGLSPLTHWCLPFICQAPLMWGTPFSNKIIPGWVSLIVLSPPGESDTQPNSVWIEQCLSFPPYGDSNTMHRKSGLWQLCVCHAVRLQHGAEISLTLEFNISQTKFDFGFPGNCVRDVSGHVEDVISLPDVTHYSEQMMILSMWSNVFCTNVKWSSKMLTSTIWVISQNSDWRLYECKSARKCVTHRNMHVATAV